MDQGKGGDGIHYHHQQQQTTTIHGEQDSLSNKIMLSTIVRLHIHRKARRRRALLASSNPSPPPPSAPCGLDPDLLRSLLVALRVRAGVEMALIDAVADSVGIPLWKLFGGALDSITTDITAEKYELCGEKIMLKADKEKLEQQLKAMDIPPAGYMPYMMVFHPAMFALPSPTLATKVSASPAFPGVPTVMGTNVLGNQCSGS